MKKRITVFTPVYNRAYTLGNLYQSLLRQGFLDFEWLIIDDGSTDNTSDLVKTWQQRITPFEIRLFSTDNGGKHRAVNKGLDYAQGEVFFVVDSDEFLSDDALEKIDRWFYEIEGDPTISGIVANKGISCSETLNPFFLEDYLDLSFLEALEYHENGKSIFGGEKAIAFYSDVHRKYKYPEFEGERFLTEAIVYNRMAHDGYKMRFYNDIICIYEYLDDGLTKAGNRLFLQNPRGYGLWWREKEAFSGRSFLSALRLWYSYYCEMTFCDEQYRLTKKQCAEYIGAPEWTMYAATITHRKRQV